MAAWPFKLCTKKQRDRQRDKNEELVDFRRQTFLKETMAQCQTLKEGTSKRTAHSSVLYGGTADPAQGLT